MLGTTKMAFFSYLSISVSRYSLFLYYVVMLSVIVLKVFRFFLYQNYCIWYSCLRTSLSSFYNDDFRGVLFCSTSYIKFSECCFFSCFQLFGDFLEFIVFLNMRLVPVLESCSTQLLISFSAVIILPKLLTGGASGTLGSAASHACRSLS